MICTEVADIPAWFAIHTHPKQETRAELNLQVYNLETFLPRIKDRRFNEISGEPVYFIKPLFPGYLFARFELNSYLHKVCFTRGVHSVVRIGDKPVPVDNRVIEIIQAQIDEGGFVKIGVDLQPGVKILVQSGPFKGLTGVFERETSAHDRIKILLDCVSFQTRVEIEKAYVKAI